MKKATFNIDKFIERAKIQEVGICCVEAISKELCDRELEINEEMVIEFRGNKIYDVDGWSVFENELDFID